MKYLNGALCLLMLLFAAVQYNDPDSLFWVPIYLVPAAWAGLAAYRPRALRERWASVGLAACLVLALAGVFHFWPQDLGWWRQDVWWESEPAREGMGIMVVTVTLCVVALTWSRAGRRALH